MTESFTMIILDLDDTLIPTSIRQSLFKNFEIDIFKISKDKFRRLQANITASLKSIKQKLIDDGIGNHSVQMALVSNAGPFWLNAMLITTQNNDQIEQKEDEKLPKSPKDKKYKKRPVYFRILSKFFLQNNCSIHSAKAENPELNESKSQHNDKSDHWMMKYKSISAVIAKRSKELNAPCTQVISFGDGVCEQEAIKTYAGAFGVRCIHFKLIPAPNIFQLNKQWELIKNHIDISSFSKLNFCIFDTREQRCSLMKTNFLLIDMNEMFSNDNDENCTGKSQLNSLSKYFDLWMKEIGIAYMCICECVNF